MEIIRKTINADNGISHRTGILPYIQFNSGDTRFMYVAPGTKIGNYGQYVCDFSLFSGTTVVSTLAYLDIMRKYNYIQEQLRHGVYCKKYMIKREVTTFEQCCEDNNNKICSATTEEYDVCILKTDFKENFLRYEYTPLNIDEFFQNTLGDYEGIDEISDSAKEILSGSTFFVLIPNYEKVIKYNQDWIDWWKNAYSAKEVKKYDSWEKEFLDSSYTAQYAIGFQFCYDMDKYALGQVEVPMEFNGSAITGTKVPAFVYYTNYLKYYKEFSRKDLYALTKESKIYKEEIGGEPFKAFLSTIKPKWITKKWDITTNNYVWFTVPKVNMDIQLTATIGKDVLQMPYIYSVETDEDGSNLIVDANLVKDYDGTGTNLSPHYVDFSGKGITIESQLSSLYSENAETISEEIYGIYNDSKYDSENNEYPLYKGTFHSVTSTTIPSVTCYQAVLSSVTLTENGYNCSWWEFNKANVTDISSFTCVDGVGAINSSKCYANITMLAMVNDFAERYLTDLKDNDFHYFLVKAENGITNVNNCSLLKLSGDTIQSIKIPYESGIPLNIRSFPSGYTYEGKIYSSTTVFDIIDNINIDGNKITFDYYIGVESGDTFNVQYNAYTTGIHLRDTYYYYPNTKMSTYVNDSIYTEVYYDKIDYDSAKEYIYSQDFRLYREAISAELIGMPVASHWYSGCAMTAPIIANEMLNGMEQEPAYDFEFTIDRGTATAWESHFKLTECNTLEDLENYGNNYFNL